ncbi:MAG TPA: FAD-dependent oxidoreductase [Halanaerobiales bacterium]|nr:FAD-dependent oxidoreductase [Halanaerobiales bacterium]
MSTEKKVYDVAIVGCGPAGLSAAVNAKARNLDFIILGSEFCSPKMYKAPEINNYLGFFEVSGEELRQAFLKHVKAMEIKYKREKVDNIFNQGQYYQLISRENIFKANSLVLGVGVSNEKYLKGEERLLGRGVSYCATCDAPLYREKNVAVIAYTEEGIEEANYLTEIAKNVYFIPEFDINSSSVLEAEIIEDKPIAILGDNLVTGVKLENREIDVDGAFIYREVTPPEKLLPGLNTIEKHIEVDENMATNLDGVFAAGDCTGKPYQLGKAVGQGQIAALSAGSYVYQKKKEE